MRKYQAVISTEIRTEVFEKVIKHTHVDYIRGGSLTVERIERRTVKVPYALLACGHSQKEDNYGAAVLKAKRFICGECEREQYERDREKRLAQPDQQVRTE